jgi:hypothetical protein
MARKCRMKLEARVLSMTTEAGGVQVHQVHHYM